MTWRKINLKNKICSELANTDMRVPIVFAVICFILGILSAVFTSKFELYEILCLPDASIPGFMFVIIWSIIYLAIGLAFGLVVSKRDRCSGKIRRKACLYFVAMLLINLFYAPLFFDCELFFIGFIMICAMIFLTFFIILFFCSLSHLGGIIMIIYWLWLLYSAYLNLAILFLN